MKMENTNLNIPDVTVDSVIEMLSLIYSNAIKSKTELKKIPTPFLWGPAGIGKSEGVYELSKKLKTLCKKEVYVTDIRLLLFSPVDLRGVPIADSQRQFSKWLMPEIFNMKKGEDIINLLFLDELSAAPQSVQAAAYQICLDRKIGEHRLPENCIVIAAGNRTTDQSVSFKMPKALCNRLMHFNVTTNFKSWKKWAKQNEIDERIIGYLSFDNSKLCVAPESSDMAYPTPRSWSFVSSIIKNIGDIEKAHQLISACVGTDTAIEFATWIETHTLLPKVDDVLKGTCNEYPKSYDALLAFNESLISAVVGRCPFLTVVELENVCRYVKRFPTDFAMTFYTELNKTEEIRLKLMKCPSCLAWFEKNKKYV